MAVAADAPSSDFIACVNKCDPSNHACIQACVATAGAPGPDYNALKACELTSCKTECPFDKLVCGGAANADPTCDACIVSSCCAEAAARNTDADALLLVGCMNQCQIGDAACVSKCFNAHSTGAPLVDALAACSAGKCHKSCVNDPLWGCIGKVMLPPLVKSQIVYQLTFRDYLSKQPLAGVAVSVCDAADVSCSAPTMTAMTDAMGSVSFTIPVSGSGFTGYIQATGTGLVPTLVERDTPLIDNVAWNVLMPTTSEAPAAYMAAGATPDPTRGVIVAVLRECTGHFAEYEKIAVDTADVNSKIAYTANLIPNQTSTQTGIDGIAFAFNIPVGTAMLTTSFATTGDVTAKAPVIVRAGAATQIVMNPN
jgi:hypothetical protein